MRKRLTPEYIAGFFDGEGSIGVYSAGKHTLRLKTQLVQNSGAADWILTALKKRFGGHSSSRRDKRAVNWQLSGKSAVAFLKFMAPRLRLKAKQAAVALRFAKRQRAPRRNRHGQFVAKVMSAADYADAAELKTLKKDGQ